LSPTCRSTLIICILGLKQYLLCQCIQKSSFPIVQKLLILKLEPDLDPEPEMLSEQGVSG